jgi:hypothetical protein
MRPPRRPTSGRPLHPRRADVQARGRIPLRVGPPQWWSRRADRILDEAVHAHRGTFDRFSRLPRPSVCFVATAPKHGRVHEDGSKRIAKVVGDDTEEVVARLDASRRAWARRNSRFCVSSSTWRTRRLANSAFGTSLSALLVMTPLHTRYSWLYGDETRRLEGGLRDVSPARSAGKQILP